MVFFDDDPVNIKDVSSIGVLSKLTPNGVTREAFLEVLAEFQDSRTQRSDSEVASASEQRIQSNC